MRETKGHSWIFHALEKNPADTNNTNSNNSNNKNSKSHGRRAPIAVPDIYLFMSSMI